MADDDSAWVDFGQKVDLCVRLRDVLVNYPEGALLKEMVQNADDAGASVFKVVLDLRTHASGSLSFPGTAAFQGPALLTYNNAVFTDTDLESIQHVGASRKTDSNARAKTGRFGVGFCSCYHVTDLPSFLSRRFLVVLDPHCRNLPNANHNEPGKMVDFTRPGLVERYTDQFEPYRAFGCDLRSEFDGTIFRLPLRTEAQAEESRIAKRPCGPTEAETLVREFVEQLPELCLFLTHIDTVEVSLWRPGEPEPERLCRLDVQDEATRRAPERKHLHRLVAAARNDLGALKQVESCTRLAVSHKRGVGEGTGCSGHWLVVQAMGGGRALELTEDPLAKAHGLQPLPWSGVAALVGSDGEDGSATDVAPCAGKPYCLLPLNSLTGLPVHINGFFELSSNRRDIWYGDDLVGGGKLRAEWNRVLLEDVAAPCYVRLLSEAREVMGGSDAYYGLWPQQRTAEPWRGMVGVMYRMLLRQPVLHSELQGGSWVSPAAAVFADAPGGADAAEASAPAEIHSVLLRSGLPLVRVPAAVESQLHEAAASSGVSLRFASGALVRGWLREHGGWEEGLTRDEAVVVLRHVVSGLLGDDLRELHGLRLLPLLDGGWGRLDAPGDASPLLLCAASERPLLAPHAGLVVDVDLETPLGRELSRVAASRTTNLKVFSAGLLPSLLPSLLPTHWRGRELAELREGGVDDESKSGGADGGEPTVDWLLQLWEFIGRQHSELPLGALAGWPLVPVEGGQAYALPELSSDGGGSRLLDMASADEALVRALRGSGCLGLDARVSRAHPELHELYVRPLSACAVLRALRAAAGGDVGGVAPLLEGLELAERRALRLLLAERRHVEERELRSDTSLPALLLSLPIFELHSGSASEAAEDGGADGASSSGVRCSSVQVAFHRLAPAGVASELLDGRFVRCTVGGEEGLLRFLGVEQPSRSAFFREHVFPRLSDLGASQRDGAMLDVLHGLHALCGEDDGFLASLRGLAFVPVRSGALRCASALFHPKVQEAEELLDGAEAFPCGGFADASVLGVLERLGMRSRVTRSAVLQSARSIQDLATSDGAAATRRARALLRYVDLNAASLIVFPPAQSATSKKSVTLMSMFGSTPAPPPAAAADPAHDVPPELFNEELAHIPWLPALVEAPEPFLPWSPEQCVACVVTADVVRPLEDRWLVSASCRILDGEVHSEVMRRLLGWATPPNLFVLAAQLGALSAQKLPAPATAKAQDGSAAEGDAGEEGAHEQDAPDGESAFRKSMALAVPTLYRAMDSQLDDAARSGDDDASGFLEQLHEQPCVWVGGEFAAPRATAFNSPLNLAPHLHAVPADLRCFSTLLRKLGVRERFEASQYLDVLEQLARRSAGSALEAAPLQMVLAIAQQLASPEHAPLPQRTIHLPDVTGLLTAAHELMYDDAPWLAEGDAAPSGSSSAAGAPPLSGIPSPAHQWKRVHAKVSHEVAELLGAHSLRRWLVARSADTFSLGLESVEAFGQHESLTSRIHNILELYADGLGIIHELVQNADDAGATRVKFVLDESTHGRSSLLSPAMAAWQGPALYSYNDAQFSPHDFKNICSIGSNAKVQSSVASLPLGAYTPTRWVPMTPPAPPQCAMAGAVERRHRPLRPWLQRDVPLHRRAVHRERRVRRLLRPARALPAGRDAAEPGPQDPLHWSGLLAAVPRPVWALPHVWLRHVVGVRRHALPLPTPLLGDRRELGAAAGGVHVARGARAARLPAQPHHGAAALPEECKTRRGLPQDGARPAAGAALPRQPRGGGRPARGHGDQQLCARRRCQGARHLQGLVLPAAPDSRHQEAADGVESDARDGGRRTGLGGGGRGLARLQLAWSGRPAHLLNVPERGGAAAEAAAMGWRCCSSESGAGHHRGYG